MDVSLRPTLLRVLTKALDIFPEGSGLFNNTRAAIGRIDRLIDRTGAGFASRRIKSGVLTILDEALERLEEHSDFVFVTDDLLDARERFGATPVLE